MIRRLVSLACILMVGPALNGPAPDVPAAPSGRPLPFFYDLYTFRGDGGRTAVIAAFAVPVGRLEREDEAGGVRYRFDVTLVVADTALRSVYRSDDSVVAAVPRPLPRRHLLHTHIEVQAPPATTTVQRVIMTDATTPGIGQLYTTPFPVPDYGGSHLMLSDVALGLPGAEAGWRRGGVTLALLPSSQFREGSFDVYYEIYNLLGGRRYATEITVESVAGAGADPRDGDSAVRTRFAGVADAGPDGTVREFRRVDASRGPGHHRLTVTVTDEATGESATRSRDFHVHGWGPEATWVAALPRGSRPAAPYRPNQ